MNDFTRNPDAYSDPEEYLVEMKYRVIRYFSMFCLGMSVLSVPASFFAKDPSILIINCIALVLYSVPVVIIVKTGRYMLGAKCLVLFAMVTMCSNAITTNFSVALPTTIWYLLYVVFSYLVLNFSWMMFVIIFTFSTTTLFTILQLTGRNVINAHFDEHTMLIGTPVTLAVALVALVYLLMVYRQLRDVMFKKVLTANNEKNQMVGVLSHDLRNHLSAIQGVCYLITDESSEENGSHCSDEITEYVTLINQASTAALQLVEEVVAAARDSMVKKLYREVHDLDQFIAPLFARYQLLSQGKGVRFIREPGSDPVYAAIDKATFSRVIENLLSNAYKFTRANDTVTVATQKDGNKVTVTIADTGIGIPPELQEIIFTPFSKAGRKGTANEKTIGLGLSIVKKLVEQHDGTITCSSEPEKGTSFTITLPAAPKQE